MCTGPITESMLSNECVVKTVWPSVLFTSQINRGRSRVLSLSVHRFEGMIFGQLVIGPPGSGKTTYCKAMSEFLSSLGRKVAIINIDPANDFLPYEPKVDVSDLVTVDEVMERLHLGPNGGLIYCMEYLESNLDWLLEQTKNVSDSYLLFDCPGQVELYTHHRSIHNIFEKLKNNDFMLAAVHLVDSFYCSDPGKFIAVVLTSLATMLQVEMPHVNVLSKCDLIEKNGELQFNLDYYTEVLDLSVLVDSLSEDPMLSKYKKMNKLLAEIIGDYSLVSFLALSIESKDCMSRVMKAVDKANGYVFGVNEENRNIQAMLSSAASADFEAASISEIQEKYMKESGSNCSKEKPFFSLGR